MNDTTSTTPGTILVTGATGNIGTGVIQRLAARGVAPRAFVRDPAAARTRLGDDIDLAVGDFSDPGSVRAALQDVHTVFLACGNVPEQVAHETAVIDAAREAGVGRIVKLSARGADAAASNAYWRAHAQIERHLEASGVPAVVLRPSFLMSNLFAAAEHVQRASTLMAPAGSACIAMVDPEDVAETAALALTDPRVTPGVLVLTGPDAISYRQVACDLSEVLGRPIAYVDVAPEAMVAGLVAAGVPEVAATEVVNVFAALRAGDQLSTEDTVARLTGQPAGSFANFARRHVAVFDQSASAPPQRRAGAYDNPFYSPQAQGAYDVYDVGDFDLEEGGRIPRLQLAYATYGTLNAAKDNAVLVPTWFSGTHRTWEQVYIGEGRALDPADHFIIVANQIGNGLSTSPHNTDDASIAMSSFPRVRIGDDVRAQRRLVTELFGIERLELVLGASMGAQQVYEWAVAYPGMVARAATIAGTAQNTPHSFLLTQSLLDAVTSDPGWAGGDYSSHHEVRAGLARHAGVWAVTGLSTEFWKRELWRGLEPTDGGAPYRDFVDFQRRFLETLFAMMDPNALLAMGWKWQHADVARHTQGDLPAALGRITAKTLVMAIDGDMFVPPRDCEDEQRLIPGSRFRLLHSGAGHFGLYGFEKTYLDEVDEALRELLATSVGLATT